MRGGVGSYGSPSTPSAEITVRMASGSGSFMSLSCGVFGPVRSTRVGRAGEQGRVVPRDYGSFACPGRCPALPYRMGQGATLDAKTPKAEPTGCGRHSGVRTQMPFPARAFEARMYPCSIKWRGVRAPS